MTPKRCKSVMKSWASVSSTTRASICQPASVSIPGPAWLSSLHLPNLRYRPLVKPASTRCLCGPAAGERIRSLSRGRFSCRIRGASGIEPSRYRVRDESSGALDLGWLPSLQASQILVNRQINSRENGTTIIVWSVVERLDLESAERPIPDQRPAAMTSFASSSDVGGNWFARIVRLRS